MSDQPYPPFSGDDTTCPKCGGGMDKRYMPAGTKFVAGVSGVFGAGPEWLLRECFDCYYQWPEMCADAYPETAMRRQPG